jgi:prenyltransferase beta subunit
MPRLTPIDAYPTKTSDLQADTEDILQEHVPFDDEPDRRVLHKNEHLQFLIRNLVQGFPARYVSQDASQPWLMFWTLQSFSTLQIGIDPETKQRCPALRSCLVQYLVLNCFRSLGQLIGSCSGSTRVEDSVVVLARPHTCCLRTHRCAVSRL